MLEERKETLVSPSMKDFVECKSTKNVKCKSADEFRDSVADPEK